MSENQHTCAFCGSIGDWRVDTLPPSWYDYLNQERSFYATSAHKVAVCPDCHDTWRLKREQCGYAPNDPREDDEVAELLDDIVLENIEVVE